MSKNNSVVPQARAALDQFKMEAAREVGVQSPLEENIQHIDTLKKRNQYNVSSSRLVITKAVFNIC